MCLRSLRLSFRSNNVNKNIEYYGELCKKMAEKSSLKHKCGAVIVYKGKVIGKGFNFCKKITTENRYCLLCS